MYLWITQTDSVEQETKRRIRSHVTKSVALQRKKGLAREPFDPRIVALNGHAAWKRHKHKKQRPSRALATDGDDKGATALSEVPEVSDDDQESPEHLEKKNSPKATAESHIVGIPQKHRERFRFVELRNATRKVSRLQSNAMVTGSSSPQSPLNMWSVEVPLHGDVMLRICANYMHRFRPEVSIEQASDVTGLVWTHYSCTILSYALCLAAFGHLYSNCSGDSAKLVGTLKGKVFRQMIKHLPATGIEMSDEMIPSIICLTGFELSRVSIECRTHLQALKTIREMKQRASRGDIPIMFEALDIIHAIMFYVPTVTGVESQMSSTARDVEHLIGRMEEQERVTQEPNNFKSDLFSKTLGLLSRLKELMGSTKEKHQVEDTTKQLFFDELEEFRKIYCLEVQLNSEERSLARKCYHTFAILYNVLANRRNMQHSSNAKHATGIYVAIRAKLGSFWDNIPYLKLFVLAVTLSAASDSIEQSVLQDRLATTIYHLGATAWDDVREFLCCFLRIRTQLDNLSNRPTANQKKKRTKPGSQLMADLRSNQNAEFATTPLTSISNNLPRFIPLTRRARQAVTYEQENSQVYPELRSRYPFSPVGENDHSSQEDILSKGYAFLDQDEKFSKILQRGEAGRISLLGIPSAAGGWISLF